MSKPSVDELQAGRQRLETLAAKTNTVVWHTRPDGSVAQPNPSWAAFTGQAFEAYRGWGWLDAIHPEDREHVAAVWREAAARGEELFESSYRLRRHDGDYRRMQAQGTPVRLDGAIREWVGVCVDVTETRRAELALRESEERLRFLDELGQATRELTDPAAIMRETARRLAGYLQATRCAYADVEPDGNRFTIRSDWSQPGVPSSVGEYALDLFGPRAVTYLHRGENLVVNDVDAELGDGGGARMFNAIGVKAIVCAGLVKDGRLLAMMAVHHAQPRRWTPAEITLIGEVVDRCWAHIERMREMAERERALLKLQMAVEAADLVMAEIDYRTNRNHISAGLARLLELGDTDLIVPRQAIFDRLHPDDRDRYVRAIMATMDPDGPGMLAIDVRGLLPSGTIRFVHIRLKITFSMIDGKLQADRGYCAARDVTAEHMAHRRLHEAQRLAESVMENAGALVYGKDLSGRYILSNQAWRQLFGIDPSHADVDDVRLFGPEVGARIRENDARVVEGMRPVVIEEKVVVRGRPATYRSSKFPLYDDSGRIYAVCGVSTDITDVVEADRRKDEFIATLAHELRNPLAPIRNGLEIMKRVPGLPGPALRVREVMDRQLAHMVRLVDDLLDVSRITRDKLDIRMEPLTLQQVLDHAVEASRPMIDLAGHELRVDLPGEPVRLTGDLTRLAQVLSNLLNNAAKYTPHGGRIDIRAAFEAGGVSIAVSDNGAGITQAMLPHVFDLFSQVDRTVHRAQGGLGIGLWLVKKLVELHGGTIAACSPGLGQGSTFTVWLPAASS